MTEPPPNDQPELAHPADLFELARQAAEQRQPDRMIEALAASGFLDGLIRRLRAKWAQLPKSEVEECVARAVDSAYEVIAKARRVRNLGAWLWKVADNLANDCWHADYAHRVSSQADPQDVPADDSLSDDDRAREDELADFRLAEAIRLARRLLPRIGQGQIIAVMELVIDAVEQGVPDLGPVEIGEVLGISTDAARTLLRRGFDRLRREARGEGIVFPHDLPSAEGVEIEPKGSVAEAISPMED